MTQYHSGAAAQQAAAIAQATRASGVIVKMTPEEFLRIVDFNDEPLVVYAHRKGFFKESHQYLTSYRGLAFYVKTPTPLRLPDHCQTVTAEGIWVP